MKKQNYQNFYLKNSSSQSSSNSSVPTTTANETSQTDRSSLNEQGKCSFVYDKIFKIKSDFNPKAHRDDRQHSKFVGLNQAKEEKEKRFPSRSSSEYGRRHQLSISFNDRTHFKVEHIKNDFYRNNGVLPK